MGKNLKGRECGKGIYQRKDGLYSARFIDRAGDRQDKTYGCETHALQKGIHRNGCRLFRLHHPSGVHHHGNDAESGEDERSHLLASHGRCPIYQACPCGKRHQVPHPRRTAHK